jgi:poly-gamma-glutamate synthesis protein (capsule biosynthesis protein)
LQDTLRAVGHSPVHVVGVGADRQAALTPYRVSVRGTTLAFFGADASFREGSNSVWAAGPHNAGLASAHAARPRALLAAVRSASSRGDVTVVYVHWGAELQGCPTAEQRVLARRLGAAGADIIVGSHAHVLLGAGWKGETYVDYGLGNFLWYHDHQPNTGVLTVRIRDGHVVDDAFAPARIGGDGPPRPLSGPPRRAAISDWRGLRHCTGLARRPSAGSGSLTPAAPYAATIQRIGPAFRARMRYSHHHGCPVAWSDLRYLTIAYVGFDGAAHRGEMVVHRRYATAIVDVFRRLYDARWPIRRMRLVDDYGGDDGRSMAANNTSGYNCRLVAGTETLSAHAYGAAIDINPVQNPYLTRVAIHPPAATAFSTVDRSNDARVPLGAIREGDVVVRAFARIGWDWGGHWPAPKDFQHFAALTH